MKDKRKIYWWLDQTLGKYIHRRMKDENITRDDLDEDTIDFFYQQFKTRSSVGHSEWSERYKRNIWVSDCEE
jgi:hypothetical protein